MNISEGKGGKLELRRRDLLGGAAGLVAVMASGGVARAASAKVKARMAAAAPSQDGSLTWQPAWRLREMIGSKEVSPVEVIRHFLNRIEKLDPTLRAFHWLHPEAALADARKAEAGVMAGEELGPLHGVPIAFKDHFMIKGWRYKNLADPGFQMAESVGERDCLEAVRLRNAGAIILGQLYSGQEFSNNPWKLDHVPGISSGGAGAAGPSGLVPISINSDGLGSIRAPGAFCGLFGMMTTRGRIPSADWRNAAPMTHMFSGPLTRDVRDAAIALRVMSGASGYDMFSLPSPPPDYLSAFAARAEGMKLAWTRDFGFTDRTAAFDTPGLVDMVRKAAFGLEQLGAQVSEAEVNFEHTAEDFMAFMSVVATNLPPERRAQPELVEAMLEKRNALWTRAHDLFGKYDLLLSPTVRFTAPTRKQWDAWTGTGDSIEETLVPGTTHANWMTDAFLGNTRTFNWLGFPAATVPVGLIDGLPVGLQIAGPPNSEVKILRLAQTVLEVLS